MVHSSSRISARSRLVCCDCPTVNPKAPPDQVRVDEHAFRDRCGFAALYPVGDHPGTGRQRGEEFGHDRTAHTVEQCLRQVSSGRRRNLFQKGRVLDRIYDIAQTTRIDGGTIARTRLLPRRIQTPRRIPKESSGMLRQPASVFVSLSVLETK